MKSKKKYQYKDLLYLFLSFFKIGLLTFGGGYAMLPVISSEVIEKRKWLNRDDVANITCVAEITPGPLAINLATYVGNKRCGFLGAVVSTLAISIPSIVIIFLISLFFNQFVNIKPIAAAFKGIKAGVVLLVALGGISILKTLPKTLLNYIVIILSFAGYATVAFLNLNFSSVYFILISVGFGIIFYVIQFLYKRKKK